MALPPRQLVPKHSGGSSAILKPSHRRQDRRQQMCPRSTTRASTDQPTCGTQKNMDTTHTHTHTHTPKLRAHASTSVTLGPPVAWMEGASGGLSLLQAGCNAATLRRGGSDVSLPDAIHDESQRCTHACQPRILPLLFPLPPTLFPLNGAWTALQGQRTHTHICTRATPC
jgi:hypothetical protein